MPINRHHPVRVLPFFGYRNRDRLRISARALRAKESDFAVGGRWRALRTMLAQFASHEIAGLRVTLSIKSPAGTEQSHEAVTDKEGFVHFDAELGGWDLPATSQWEVAGLGWNHRGEEGYVKGHILAPAHNSSVGIISDIDDTIIETGITGISALC